MISKVSQNRTQQYSRDRDGSSLAKFTRYRYVVSTAPLFFDYSVVTFGSARVVEMQTERQEKD